MKGKQRNRTDKIAALYIGSEATGKLLQQTFPRNHSLLSVTVATNIGTVERLLNPVLAVFDYVLYDEQFSAGIPFAYRLRRANNTVVIYGIIKKQGLLFVSKAMPVSQLGIALHNMRGQR